MPIKKITTKRTATGYSINVYMKDGHHVKPLVSLITKYFEVADLEKNNQKRLGGI